MIENQAKLISSLLMDEESVFIFQQRDLYYRTKENKYIAAVCERAYGKHCGISLKEQVERSGKTSVILFGCGANAESDTPFLQEMGLKLDCFCDNDPQKWGRSCHGLPILSPSELQHLCGQVFVLILPTYPHITAQINKQLLEMGFEQKDIVCLYQSLGRQYFDFEQFSNRTDHVFVDAGCLNGADCLEFIRKTGGVYKSIYAFEPDPQNFEVCQANLLDCQNTSVLPFALWNESRRLPFASTQNWGSHVNENSELLVSAVSLDRQLQDVPVTYIKMDIEGAELEALKGAEQMIRRYRPQLAICVYHKPEDIFLIPLYLHSIVPEYRFYLRHYSFCTCETVLYATPL